MKAKMDITLAVVSGWQISQIERTKTMAENSKIEWTDHTWNPWRGCTKVSPGCLNCYAETLSQMPGGAA